MNDIPPAGFSKQGSRLKLAGIVVLALGLGGAGLVYWLGTRSADLSGDLSMVRYNQPQKQQMERLYGKQGRLIQDITNGLKQPGTQAFLIAAVSAIVAAGCFYFARTPQDDNAPH